MPMNLYNDHRVSLRWLHGNFGFGYGMGIVNSSEGKCNRDIKGKNCAYLDLRGTVS